MSGVIFLGPSLPSDEAAQHLAGASLRGPAAAGDILRAVEAGARRIGLVDGYFDQKLSVWHKEILWALSRGVHVYGASSMGALRAAELRSFGMVGVGVIFGWYREGVIEADDEVAVAHEGAETGYRSTSDALVNIRATLSAAARQGLIDPAQERELIRLARSAFYPSRHLRALVRGACQAHGPAAYERLLAWLGPGRALPVNQKREDAILLLEAMRARRERDARPFVPAFEFEYTEVWHELLRQVRLEKALPAAARSPDAARGPERAGAPGAPSAAAAQPPAPVLPESAPPPDLWRTALERVLAAHLAAAVNLPVDPAETQRAADEFRRRHGLLTTEQTLGWLGAKGLSPEAFSRLMHGDVALGKCGAILRRLVLSEVEVLMRLER